MSKKWFLAALLAAATPAAAHDWYPIECCSGMDCAAVEKVEMVPGPGIARCSDPGLGVGPGAMLVTTKHGTVVVPANFPRRESKDNRMHACMRPDQRRRHAPSLPVPSAGVLIAGQALHAAFASAVAPARGVRVAAAGQTPVCIIAARRRRRPRAKHGRRTPMRREKRMRHGGKILIDQLEAQGATTAFTVPGESFLAALDGLHDSNRIKTIICRQEGGASMMAEAWGKITGEPGICFVTRGPGAANAMSGLHVAQQDSTPMVTFVGLPGLGHEDREAFQEIETKELLSSFVKWAAVIRQTERIPEYVSHAFHVARSGRPGPVVLGLPEDMLAAECEAADAKPARIAGPIPAPPTWPRCRPCSPRPSAR